VLKHDYSFLSQKKAKVKVGDAGIEPTAFGSMPMRLSVVVEVALL